MSAPRRLTPEVIVDHEPDHPFRVAGAGPPRPPRRHAVSAWLSSAAFLLGLWLVVSPFALGYGVVGAWFTGHGNEVVTGVAVGCAVAALGGTIALLVRPQRTAGSHDR
ncbi:hypothetical protein ACIQMJ_27440 [Actinosynnema sp. NPDC091369]